MASKRLVLASCILLIGCASDLERRVARLEREIAQVQQGLLSNDQKLNRDISRLQSETNGLVNDVKKKTDKFCVETPSKTSIMIKRNGYCS